MSQLDHPAHSCSDQAIFVSTTPARKNRGRARDNWRCGTCGARWSTVSGRGPDRRRR